MQYSRSVNHHPDVIQTIVDIHIREYSAPLHIRTVRTHLHRTALSHSHNLDTRKCIETVVTRPDINGSDQTDINDIIAVCRCNRALYKSSHSINSSTHPKETRFVE